MRFLILPEFSHGGDIQFTSKMVEMLNVGSNNSLKILPNGAIVDSLSKEQKDKGATTDNNLVMLNASVGVFVSENFDSQDIDIDVFIGIYPREFPVEFDAIYCTNKALYDAQIDILESIIEKDVSIVRPFFFTANDVTLEGTMEEIVSDIQQRTNILLRGPRTESFS